MGTQPTEQSRIDDLEQLQHNMVELGALYTSMGQLNFCVDDGEFAIALITRRLNAIAKHERKNTTILERLIGHRRKHSILKMEEPNNG